MRISVLVPTFRRPVDLSRCLAALAAQRRRPDELLVVVRDSDDQTRRFLESDAVDADLRSVTVSQPGVVAAMNAGLHAAGGDIVALTDDDAAPRPDWIERIEQAFGADPSLGGFGGRDYVYHEGKLAEGRATDAGVMNWFGRLSSGHHLVVGPPREVDVLKGVNCAYRAAPLRQIGFDTRLAGTGAQVHWELSLGLSLKRAGWKLVLDPALAVDHYPARRFDEDQRGRVNRLAQSNAVANETLAIFEHLAGVRRAMFLIWGILIGTSGSPGVAQFFRLLLRRERGALECFDATLRGRVQGLGMYRCGRSNRPGRADSTGALGGIRQQGASL